MYDYTIYLISYQIKDRVLVECCDMARCDYRASDVIRFHFLPSRRGNRGLIPSSRRNQPATGRLDLFFESHLYTAQKRTTPDGVVLFWS